MTMKEKDRTAVVRRVLDQCLSQKSPRLTAILTLQVVILMVMLVDILVGIGVDK